MTIVSDGQPMSSAGKQVLRTGTRRTTTNSYGAETACSTAASLTRQYLAAS